MKLNKESRLYNLAYNRRFFTPDEDTIFSFVAGIAGNLILLASGILLCVFYVGVIAALVIGVPFVAVRYFLGASTIFHTPEEQARAIPFFLEMFGLGGLVLIGIGAVCIACFIFNSLLFKRKSPLWIIKFTR